MIESATRPSARRSNRVLLAPFAILAVARLALGCSLGNVSQDDCEDDAACVAAFGLGSSCVEGYCTAAPSCTKNADCRDALGPMTVCEEKVCAPATLDARCTLSEPPELIEALRTGQSTGDTLLLGVMLRQDGNGNQQARTAAVQLAVREMNEAGGVVGRQLGAVVCNTEGSDVRPETIDELVLHLGDVVGAPVIVGPAETSDTIRASIAVVTALVPIAIISPSATGKQLTKQTDRLNPDDPVGLLWRTAPSDVLQAKVMARQIGEALADAEEDTRISVFYQDDPYGQGFEEALRDELEIVTEGRVVPRSEKYAPDDVEGTIGPAVDRATEEEPAAVVIIAGRAERAVAVLERTSGEALLRTLPFFLSDGAKDKAKLLGTKNDAIDAILASAIGTAPFNPEQGSFFDSLRSDFGIEASQFGFVAHAYDAAYVAAYGLAHASRTGGHLDGQQAAVGFSHLAAGDDVQIGPSTFSQVVDALLTDEGTVNIRGESGPLDFDPATGDAPGPIEVWRVEDGEFVTVGEPQIPE